MGGGATSTKSDQNKKAKEQIKKKAEKAREAVRNIRDAAKIVAAIGTLAGQPEIGVGAAAVFLGSYAIEGAIDGLEWAATDGE